MKIKKYFILLLTLSFLMINVVCAMEPSVKTVSVQIPVSCTGENTSETFTYILTSKQTEHQSIKQDTLTLQDGEQDVFLIQYDYPGTYHYNVVQKKGSDDETVYDETEYTVDVYVTENERGSLFAEAIAYVQGDDQKKESLDFTNEKKAEPAPKSTKVPQKTKAPQATKAPQVTKAPQKVLKSNAVKTGDDTPVATVLAVMGISGILILSIIFGMVRERKKKHEKK